MATGAQIEMHDKHNGFISCKKTQAQARLSEHRYLVVTLAFTSKQGPHRDASYAL